MDIIQMGQSVLDVCILAKIAMIHLIAFPVLAASILLEVNVILPVQLE
jgi:hypothetical protein